MKTPPFNFGYDNHQTTYGIKRRKSGYDRLFEYDRDPNDPAMIDGIAIVENPISWPWNMLGEFINHSVLICEAVDRTEVC
jgi:hypothetical protein